MTTSTVTDQLVIDGRIFLPTDKRLHFDSYHYEGHGALSLSSCIRGTHFYQKGRNFCGVEFANYHSGQFSIAVGDEIQLRRRKKAYIQTPAKILGVYVNNDEGARKIKEDNKDTAVSWRRTTITTDLIVVVKTTSGLLFGESYYEESNWGNSRRR
ncbi:MAG: hypothetical protein WC444_01855 [Candidatus Paceibacterota bacterium]